MLPLLTAVSVRMLPRFQQRQLLLSHSYHKSPTWSNNTSLLTTQSVMVLRPTLPLGATGELQSSYNREGRGPRPLSMGPSQQSGAKGKHRQRGRTSACWPSTRSRVTA